MAANAEKPKDPYKLMGEILKSKEAPPEKPKPGEKKTPIPVK